MRNSEKIGSYCTEINNNNEIAEAMNEILKIAYHLPINEVLPPRKKLEDGTWIEHEEWKAVEDLEFQRRGLLPKNTQ